MNNVPYGIDNYLQIKLAAKGMDVENFVNRMNSMDDLEIASELDVSLNEARDMKREFQRGMVASQIVVD